MLLVDHAKPDKDGVPSCTVLADRPYRIRLTGFAGSFGTQDTPEVLIPAGRNDVEVNLLIGPKDAAAPRRGRYSLHTSRKLGGGVTESSGSFVY